MECDFVVLEITPAETITGVELQDELVVCDVDTDVGNCANLSAVVTEDDRSDQGLDRQVEWSF